MKKVLPKKLNSNGQMLIGVLVAIAIFLILAHALFTLVATSFELVSFNKARTTARHIASEKMETIRNLPYDDVATVGGAPLGTLPQTETVNRNGLSFTVETSITYVDDPFDGTQGGTPNDDSPGDYKRARIEVSWEGVAASRKNPVVMITDIAANVTTTTEGGTLTILVFDAYGNPVPQATVTVVAASLGVNLTQETGSEGKVSLPAVEPCVSCYEITVTKSGMSTDRTYGTNEVANPIKPHTSVFADDLTQISFAIDTWGQIDISSLNSRINNFSDLGSVPFRIHGNKIIGTDAFAQPVYKYDETLTTDGSGSKILTEMEWDIYHVEMPSVTSYDTSGTTPLLPLNLSPGVDLDFTFSVETHSDHNILLTVKDPTQALIASASAHLTEAGGYDESKFTGAEGDPDFGQVLFPDLEELTYTLNATASGFLNYNGVFDVSGPTSIDIVMTPE